MAGGPSARGKESKAHAALGRWVNRPRPLPPPAVRGRPVGLGRRQGRVHGAGLWSASGAVRHGLPQLARNIPCLLADRQLLLHPRGKLPREEEGALEGEVPYELGALPVWKTQGRERQIATAASGEQRRPRGLLPKQLRDRKEERI